MSASALFVAGLLVGVVIGVVVGAALYLRRSRRQGGHRVDAALRSAGLEELTGGSDPVTSVVRVVREVSRLRSESVRVERRLQGVLESLPRAVMLFDDTGSVIVANTTGGRLLAGGAGEALAAGAVRELLADGGDRAIDLVGPPPRYLEVSVRVLADGCRLAVVEDTSERRHLEGVRRDFVANISHELRTPVGAMVVLTEAMAGESDPAVLERLGAKVHREAVRVSEAIDDLIELSRLEHDARPEIERIAVTSLFAEAVGRVASAAEERRIAIRCAVDGGDSLHADARQVVSALVNLLDNAVKYSEPGSTVTLSARPCTLGAGAPGVCLDVADEGIGIPARDLDRIFERFYRVDRARSRSTGGIGLGLAIVRHVAHNHGGEVDVVSQEGTGTTFTLRIPARPPTDDAGDGEERA